MSLDLLKLSGQVREMTRELATDMSSFEERITAARDLLTAQSSDWEFWRDVVAEEKDRQTWLLAMPCEPIIAAYDPPVCPPNYAVTASDGSQIEVNHHGNLECWLVNIGTVALTYGSDSSFRAESQPKLGFRDNDITIQDPRSGRKYGVNGAVLAAHRDLHEGLGLAEITLTLPPDLPRVALQDGTLIRWTLQGFEPWLQDRFLGDYLTFLETLQELPCPVASYLSRPRSPEVTGLVRYLHVQGNIKRWQEIYPRRSDDPFRGVMDHLIFADLLREGQRSARFQSMSRINVEEYPSPHKIQFFYLKIGREVARVEFPAWVAEKDLDLVHSLIYDQCRRGMGYPVALQRAHEQAVIHNGDKLQLESLIERFFIKSGVTAGRSAKSISKLRPGL